MFNPRAGLLGLSQINSKRFLVRGKFTKIFSPGAIIMEIMAKNHHFKSVVIENPRVAHLEILTVNNTVFAISLRA